VGVHLAVPTYRVGETLRAALLRPRELGGERAAEIVDERRYLRADLGSRLAPPCGDDEKAERRDDARHHDAGDVGRGRRRRGTRHKRR